MIVVAAAASAAVLLSRGTSSQFRRDGISVQVPKGWRVTDERINGVVDPVTVFTASTFRIAARATSSGICSPPLQRAWRASGAYVQLAEERDGASLNRMLPRVQARPKHFVLSARGRGGLCSPADSGELTFKQRCRAFYVFYGIGRKASKLVRARVVALLDSMKIAARQ
ncbi:MAG: hypothetical protein ACJ75G_08470 [Gaiellaceae bacterium]